MIYVPLDVRETRLSHTAVHTRTVIEVAHSAVLPHHCIRVAPGDEALAAIFPRLADRGNYCLDHHLSVLSDAGIVRIADTNCLDIVFLVLQASTTGVWRTVSVSGVQHHLQWVEVRQPFT